MNIFKALGAFNYNAATHLAYIFTINMWTIIIVIMAVIVTALSVISAIETTVTEEQNIL